MRDGMASLSRVAPLFLLGLGRAVMNGVGDSPLMGWNNWNSFQCDVSEHLVLSTAARLPALGLQDLGYEYVVLDDCWQNEEGRSSDGVLRPNLSRFPHGMKSVSDQLHALRLKFGMYSSAGEMTCARFDGSLGHEKQDARSFASWGVDLLKYDNCFNRGLHGSPSLSFNRFHAMAEAIKETGRQMALTICNWGEDEVHSWGMSLGNSWRATGDIYDSFSRSDDLCTCNISSGKCLLPALHCSVLFILNYAAPIIYRGIPGGWADLDTLEVGHGGMTDEEYKAHFALWAALKSPLMLGNDLREMSPSALSIVNNPAIIALSQDPLGRPAIRVRREVGGDLVPDQNGAAETHIWSGPLHNGDQVLILLNAAGAAVDMRAPLSEIFVEQGPGGSAPHAKCRWAVHDLWADRMADDVALSLVKAANGDEAAEIYRSVGWYNATARPFSEGLSIGDHRLFGKKVNEIEPGGALSVRVESHSAAVFRLRRIPQKGDQFKPRSTDRMGVLETKDEL